MWLAFYNNEGIGDVLLLTSGNIKNAVTETKGKVTIIKEEESEKVKSINLYDISEKLSLSGRGPIELSNEQVDLINSIIEEAGFEVEVSVDNRPKFVVGHVEECRPHEDSDHLSITLIKVDEEESLQIVCGARNIAKGLKVMVALPGAVMPSGLIIWPGELRGVVSNGMVCSTRELNLTHIEDYPGIWELDKNLAIGTALNEVIDYYA